MRKDKTSFDYELPIKGICNVAAAIVGSAVVGGVASSSAARSASKTQAAAAAQASDATLAATRETNALQWQMYQQNLRNQQPFLQGGQTAYAALLGGMGLGGAVGQPGVPQKTIGPVSQPGMQPQAAPTFTNAQGQIVDAQGKPAPAASPYGGIQNYGATPEQMQTAAAQYAGPTGAGRFTETFKPSDLTTDPSYQWRLDQGLQALKASRAATGTLQTGQGLKDIVNYSQGAASQEYGAAFDRFMRNQETAYGRLAGLAGIGTNTAGNIGTAGQTAAGQIGQTAMQGTNASNQALLGGAQAMASGTVGQANAISGAMQGGIQNWMGYQYLNRPQVGYYNQGQFMGPPGP